MTDEQRASHIKALLKERGGMVQLGRDDRVAAIDEQLRKFGVDAAPPAKRASKRKAG